MSESVEIKSICTDCGEPLYEEDIYGEFDDLCEQCYYNRNEDEIYG